MKKALTLVLVLVMILIVAAAIKVTEAKIEAAYNSGFEAGIQHAINDAELWVEIHNSFVNILIKLDGNVYEHKGGVDYAD